jgi:hypothetical protein
LTRAAAPTAVGYFGAGPEEYRSSQRRPAARTDLTPDLPGRRLAPFGQLREALARHNARLNANSSDICCSRSIKASKPRKIDSVQIDIKYPTSIKVLEHKLIKVAAHFLTFRSQTLGKRRPKFRRLDDPNCHALSPLYLEVRKLLAGSELLNKPARLLSSARPSLAAIFRVLILRKDLRVRTALATDVDRIVSRSNSAKPFFEPNFFRRNLFG